MKNSMKLLAAGAALVGAAVGVAAYRKYRDSYVQLSDESDVFETESDFEQVAAVEDDFTYYIQDADQIMFYE